MCVAHARKTDTPLVSRGFDGFLHTNVRTPGARVAVLAPSIFRVACAAFVRFADQMTKLPPPPKIGTARCDFDRSKDGPDYLNFIGGQLLLECTPPVGVEAV